MIYVIPGNPVALARPRLTKKKIYDSQRNEKLVAGINLKNQHGDQPLFEGPIHLDVNFYLKMPARQNPDKMEGRWHIFKPDLSNLLKFIEDIGSGVIYKDDCIICSVTATKYYGKEPRTEFEIKTL